MSALLVLDYFEVYREVEKAVQRAPYALRQVSPAATTVRSCGAFVTPNEPIGHIAIN